nr:MULTISPECIES: hypothetical protein [Mumia]
MGGITDQEHRVPRPGVEHDLLDLARLHGGRGVERFPRVEQGRHRIGIASQQLAQGPRTVERTIDIAVDLVLPDRDREERRSGPETHRPGRWLDVVLDDKASRVLAELPDTAASEDQLPDRGVDPVRAQHEVVRGRRPSHGDVDAGIVERHRFGALPPAHRDLTDTRQEHLVQVRPR